MSTPKTSATFCALVFTFMNSHMRIECATRRKIFSTLTARMPFSFSLSFYVNMLLDYKPFAISSRQTRRRLSISVITAISFSLYFTATFTCIICTTRNTVSFIHTSRRFTDHVSYIHRVQKKTGRYAFACNFAKR